MADEATEVSHWRPAAFQEIATLKDIAMDFTSENWEQLGQGQGDLFWDMALDNYWNLFLLSECHPCPGSHRPAQDHPWLSVTHGVISWLLSASDHCA